MVVEQTIAVQGERLALLKIGERVKKGLKVTSLLEHLLPITPEEKKILRDVDANLAA